MAAKYLILEDENRFKRIGKDAQNQILSYLNIQDKLSYCKTSKENSKRSLVFSIDYIAKKQSKQNEDALLDYQTYDELIQRLRERINVLKTTSKFLKARRDIAQKCFKSVATLRKLGALQKAARLPEKLIPSNMVELALEKMMNSHLSVTDVMEPVQGLRIDIQNMYNSVLNLFNKISYKITELYTNRKKQLEEKLSELKKMYNDLENSLEPEVTAILKRVSTSYT